MPEPDSSLRERKQQRAREQIIAAAFSLFAERGFSRVTVADIAERAEVGRTTFFRHFGDKQEVVFADEQGLVDTIAGTPASGPAPTGLPEALAALRELIPAIGSAIVGHPARYAEHERLVAANPELQDRANRKLLRVADALQGWLARRGAPAPTAVLAAQVAVAVFRAAQRVCGPDPAQLLPTMLQMADELVASSTRPPQLPSSGF